MRRVLPLLALVLLCSCARDSLYVINEYVGKQSLASYHVGTPDPAQENPSLGQRLFVSWNLLRSDFRELTNPELVLDLRYKKGLQETVRQQLRERSGTYMYDVIDEDYLTKGEIRTYRARIVDGDHELERWQHQLWAEWIQVGESL